MVGTQFWIVLPQPFECTKVFVQGCVVSWISGLIRDKDRLLEGGCVQKTVVRVA